MFKRLHNAISTIVIVSGLLLSSVEGISQATVFSQDFSTSAGTTYSTQNGQLGTSPTWSFLRSGTDMGARINSGYLSLTNDATGSWNSAGWVLAYASAFSAPYSTTLMSNPGAVTWTFNMRQSRSNPSSLASGYYGNAFILAGSSNTTATTGSGYAVILGNSGNTDPLKLVRYTAGLRTNTPFITSNTSGLTDFGNQYLSVKVVYTPATNNWELYVRNDGAVFQDPATGNYTLQGSVQSTNFTNTALPIIGGFWNAGMRSGQTSFFDNIKVTVALPSITSISPTSRVAASGSFALTVNGTNFTSGSTVKWNGTSLVTSFVNATQLTATVPAANIATAGTASITVGTGTSTSNSQVFTIDPAAVPSVSASTNVLSGFFTTTGTASAVQNFTVTGANLTANVTVTAPANFEVSTNATSGFADNTTLLKSGTTLTGQPVTVYVRIKQSAQAAIYSNNITIATTGGASKFVAVSGKAIALEPQFSDSAITFSNTNSISFTVGWTNSAASNHLVVVRAGSPVNGIPTDGVSTSASAAFGAGSQLGTDNYVVYNATGNAVTVTNLTPNTTYHVAIYAFNGSGGTENYKTSSPLTGSRATVTAPVNYQITTVNSINTINFDATREGVNSGPFTGGGINQAPQTGELNSYAFAFTGFADGAITYGGDSPEGSDSYENGNSDGGVTEGGVYGFEVDPGNFALGFQPEAGEFAPGTVTLRFLNNTGANMTSLSVGYKVYVFNDEAGSNSFNFSHSSVATSGYVNVAALDQVTPAAADAAPSWKAYYKVATISGITVAPGAYYYLRWNGATVSGTAFDEVALDDISIVINPSSNYASFNGTAETFAVAGRALLSGDVTVLDNITFSNNSWLSIGGNTLTLSGSVTNTTSGGIRGITSSNLIIDGSLSRTLSFDQTLDGTTNIFNNFSVLTGGAGIVTAANNLAVAGTLTVNEGQTLNLGTATLTGALTTIINDGTIATQNTTSTPFASGRTWGGTGTLILNAATSSQKLPAGTYNNVTVTTTGGAAASGDITVNGVFHLPNANPTAILGAFSTGNFTMYMTSLAKNTGIGDVSGIVTRNSGITSNVLYTFGHPETSILLPPVGTLPTSMSLKTILGSAPVGKTDGILRSYDFIQTGGGGADAAATKAIIKAHYLDSELNGNTENRLVDWVVVYPSLTTVEQGRSNYSTTENWVELGNVNISFFASDFGNRQLTLANLAVANSVWNGSQSTSWTTAENWTPNAMPNTSTKVIIPAGTPRNPTINQDTFVNTISIEPGAVVNGAAGANLTISGSTGAWINNGTFNPVTSKVIFSGNTATIGDATIAGATNFYNLTVNTGTTLRGLTDSYIKIGNTFTKDGSFIVGSVETTVEYSGTNQTVVTPNGAQLAYHNLVISGSGAIIPASLNINGDLITNNVVNFAGTTINLSGSDFENQSLKGTVPPVFNNLNINKTNGDVILNADATVGGTLNFTTGLFNINNYNLTLGTAAVTGTFSTTSMIVAEGTGLVRRPYAGTGSYFFPIGEKTSNTTYSPIAVNITAGSFTNAFVGVNLRDAVHPDNRSTENYLTRYWNVTQTGITGAIATITANYVTGDAVGGEANLGAAQLDGNFNVTTNPWKKFGTLSGNTLTAANVVLTPGQASAFTGIKGQSLTALITGQGSFCQNEQVVLTAEVSAGDPPFTYAWSNGLGNASTAVPSTAAAGTTTYTLTVTDVNGITSIATADVVVSLAPVAGTLTGNQEICAGAAAPVTLTGYTGNILRWERSTSTAFTNPAFIASTSPTLSGALIGNFTTTRYIRAVVQNGSCPEVYSNPVEIKVTTATWDGASWSPSAPSATTAVIFTGNYTATENLEACSITVNNNAEIVIPEGINVTLNGQIAVASGSFTLKNNANLIQLTAVENTGNIIVERNSSLLYRQDYTLWSSPVRNQNVFAFSPNTLASRFYTYSPITDFYTLMFTTGSGGGIAPYDPATTTFTNGQGYLIRMPNGAPEAGYVQGTTAIRYKGVFTGVPNNGDITVATTPEGPGVQGFNAVGNPYPSPINISSFFAGNNGGTSGVIYLWRKKNNEVVSSAYATVNAVGDFVGNGQPGSDNPNGVLQTGQGFIVKALTGTINFTNAMRSASTGHDSSFFRMNNDTAEPADEAHRIWLNLAKDGVPTAQMLIGYRSNATMGEDAGIDALFINDVETGLNSLIDGKAYVIQGRSLPFNAQDAVALQFKTAVAGNFTIGIDHVDGLFAQGKDIYLKDNLLGMTHNLTTADYTFTSEAGIVDNRFEVVYVNQALGTNDPKFDANTVMIYKQHRSLHVNTGTALMDNVKVFDTRGRLVYEKSNINSAETEISDLQAQEQMLIVQITTVENGKVSKKIIY